MKKEDIAELQWVHSDAMVARGMITASAKTCHMKQEVVSDSSDDEMELPEIDSTEQECMDPDLVCHSATI